MKTTIALLAILLSLAVLEASRWGVGTRTFAVGTTPVTSYAVPGADGPVVVVAHGFAGSRQMMQGYALPLAQAGYRVFVFDFLGHGRNPVPMSGDVTALDGTTRLLMDQTAEVIDAVADGSDPVALIGHSMATDVLARVARERLDVGPVVLISAFSDAIDGETPKTLLLIPGAWEGPLRAFARAAVEMVAPGASENETVRQGDVTRRAQVAPFSEHVSVLHSRVGRAAAVDWLDAAYGRTSAVTIWATGWAIMGLLGGLVLLFSTVARMLPQTDVPAPVLSGRQLAIATLLPATVAPLLAVPLEPDLLPVLVANYLVLHLAIFGAVQLVLLRYWGVRPGGLSLRALGLLLVWGALFGFALDRYAANFWPTSGRVWIIGAMALGAVPCMMADAILTHRATFRRRLAVRGAFLLSLGIAVALDPEGLFFLAIIAPVIVLFYLVFGTMGRQSSLRAGPLASGLALGLILAWSLGVSFPLFRA